MKDSATAKYLRQWDFNKEVDAAHSAAVRDAVGKFEGDAKGVAAYRSHKACQAGSTLAQERYDEQFRTGI